ncbi:MAG: hypothetical protein ACTSYX_03635 [Candidatus Thorarchaeota archaeon]
MTEPNDDYESPDSEQWRRLWDRTRASLRVLCSLDAGPPPPVSAQWKDAPAARDMNATLQMMYRRLVERSVTPEGLVVWLCAVRAFSSTSLCDECVRDLATELARQSVREQEARIWEQVWSEVAPRVRLEPNLVYNPSVSFPHLHRAVGKNGVETIIRELVAYTRTGAELSFRDYVTYLSRRVLRFVARIDATDAKIIAALLGRPGLRVDQLASELGMTAQWVASKIARLKRRMILREFKVVPFSRIRIRMFHLFLRAREPDTDMYDLVRDCPLLYGHREVLAGDWNFYAVLCEPEGPDCVRWQEPFVRLAALWGVEAQISEIRASGASYCFDYYSPSESGWKIPWGALSLWVERILRGEDCGPRPIVMTRARPTSLYLDEVDMRIVDAVRRGVRGISAIRKAVRAGQNRVARRLREMQQAGVITKRWGVNHVGLIEGAMVYTDNSIAGTTIRRLASQLPRAIVSVDDTGYHVLTVDLPGGGAVRLIRVLRPLRDHVRFAVLDDYVYGGWGLPTSSWDATTQSWRFPADKVRAWLDQLR